MSMARGAGLTQRRGGWAQPAPGWHGLLVWMCAAMVLALLALGILVSLPPSLRRLPGTLGADQTADYSANPSGRFAPQRAAGGSGQPSP